MFKFFKKRKKIKDYGIKYHTTRESSLTALTKHRGGGFPEPKIIIKI